MAAEKILIADDDVHIVELVSFYLKRAGYTVATAFDGDVALKRATEEDPALAVLDIMMPGPDGLQVCRALRERGDLPIILLTARSTDIDKIAGLRLGADDTSPSRSTRRNSSRGWPPCCGARGPRRRRRWPAKRSGSPNF